MNRVSPPNSPITFCELWATRYRPEIDGLSTIAVVPVILFHATIGFFEGGFVGVNLFFIICGYTNFQKRSWE